MPGEPMKNIREYSPYVVTQLRGALTAARLYKLSEFEAWDEIQIQTKVFHEEGPGGVWYMPEDIGNVAIKRRSSLWRDMLVVSTAQANNAHAIPWEDFEDYRASMVLVVAPKLLAQDLGTRWTHSVARDKTAMHPADKGASCLEVLENAWDNGLVRRLAHFHRVAANNFAQVRMVKGELKALGYATMCLTALIKPMLNVRTKELLPKVPATDELLLDMYWEHMRRAGIAGRGNLHKPVNAYMTRVYNKRYDGSKVSKPS